MNSVEGARNRLLLRGPLRDGVYGAGVISVCAAEAPGTEPAAHCGLPVGHDGTHQVYYRDRLLDWPQVVGAVVGRRLWQPSSADLVAAH